jgi:hypothetical protein
MNEESPNRDGPILSKRQIVVQVVGFVLGGALLAWCIWIAVDKGDWGRVREADWRLVAGLAGFTLGSLLANALIFWVTVQPVRRVRVRDMTWLIFVTSLLNYAPIRAGLVARVVYNLRVDGLSALQIAAWFAAIGLTLATSVGALFAATILRPDIDWLWAVLVVVQIAIAGFILRALAGHPLLVSRGRGVDRMLRSHAALWGGIGLRVVDVASLTGRMWCAAAIMGLDFSAPQIVILSIASLAFSLIPLGRIGYREAGVAFVAGLLSSGAPHASALDAQMIQLALIESAGEALVFIPLGILALPWYWRRVMRRRRSEPRA